MDLCLLINLDTPPGVGGVDCSNLLIRHFFEINLLIKKTRQICPPQAEFFGISCELTVKYSCFWTVRAGFPLSFHKNMVKLSRVVNACPWERFRWQCTSPPPGISTLYDFFRVYSSLCSEISQFPLPFHLSLCLSFSWFSFLEEEDCSTCNLHV